MKDPATEARRAKWRRNKQAQRAKHRPEPAELRGDFVAAVLCERDRRSSREAMRWIRKWPELDAGSAQGRPLWINRDNWLGFAADVWAAMTLLRAMRGVKVATPTNIVKWLEENGRLHGYAVSSARRRVTLARNLIEVLEAASAKDPLSKHWRRFHDVTPH